MSDGAPRPRRRLRELADHWLRRRSAVGERVRVDADLVEVHGPDGSRRLDLARLITVDVAHGTATPIRWSLGTAEDVLAIPASAMPEELLERLLALPGFDREALARATTGEVDGAVRCWTAPGVG